MREVEIPGGTATLRERADMTVRQRRLIEIAGMSANRAIEKVRGVTDEHGEVIPELAKDLEYSAGEAESLMNAQDATIIAYLEDWTLDRDLPTMDTVGDLPIDLYDALAQATRRDGADAVVGPVDFGETPDRDRPTGSSTGSTRSSMDPGSLVE